MIRATRDAHIIELAPGIYWKRDLTRADRCGTVGCPTLASLVRQGRDGFNLEGFPRDRYPHLRVVKVRLSLEELDPPIARYSDLFLDWALCRASPLGMSAADEHRFAAGLRACAEEMLPPHREDFEFTLARLRRANERKVFLDDERAAPDGWTRVKTADGAIIFLTHFTVTDLSLDHDLGDGHGSGYDVACWLENAVLERGYPMPNVTIHSQNPVGRANIQRVLDQIQRRVEALHP